MLITYLPGTNRREFAELFKDDISIFSMDDMNKIKVGPPAVSRYHQLRRLYSSSDMPNMPDHDFPRVSYKHIWAHGT